MTRVSPSSSPRLPSPPPMAEDQLGPKSPIATVREEHGNMGVMGTTDHGASRRIRPGTKAANMAEGPPLVDLSEIDSAFQLTEHLKALHHSLTHPASSPTTTVPLDRASSMRLAEPPEGVDKHLWLFELCLFLTQKANAMVVALFADEPPCSAQTQMCHEMRASEWQYLCAVHDPPKPCSAIDYSCHTLDWAANTLTSPKHFPSRLALFGEDDSDVSSGSGSNGGSNASSASGGGGGSGSGVVATAGQQLRHLTNIFRRVYRIFAHAWFSHREAFWRVESATGLYTLFKTVCDAYSLIPVDNYTIPDEAEGGGDGDEEVAPTPTVESAAQRRQQQQHERETQQQPGPQQPSTILRRPSGEQQQGEPAPELTPAGNATLAAGNTTRRHRASPSNSSVSMVIEEAEDEDEPHASSAPHPEPNTSEPATALPDSEGAKAMEAVFGDAPVSHDANENEDDVAIEARPDEADDGADHAAPDAEETEDLGKQDDAEAPGEALTALGDVGDVGEAQAVPGDDGKVDQSQGPAGEAVSVDQAVDAGDDEDAPADGS